MLIVYSLTLTLINHINEDLSISIVNEAITIGFIRIMMALRIWHQICFLKRQNAMSLNMEA